MIDFLFIISLFLLKKLLCKIMLSYLLCLFAFYQCFPLHSYSKETTILCCRCKYILKHFGNFGYIVFNEGYNMINKYVLKQLYFNLYMPHIHSKSLRMVYADIII